MRVSRYTTIGMGIFAVTKRSGECELHEATDQDLYWSMTKFALHDRTLSRIKPPDEQAIPMVDLVQIAQEWKRRWPSRSEDDSQRRKDAHLLAESISASYEKSEQKDHG